MPAHHFSGKQKDCMFTVLLGADGLQQVHIASGQNIIHADRSVVHTGFYSVFGENKLKVRSVRTPVPFRLNHSTKAHKLKNHGDH